MDLSDSCRSTHFVSQVAISCRSEQALRRAAAPMILDVPQRWPVIGPCGVCVIPRGAQAFSSVPLRI